MKSPPRSRPFAHELGRGALFLGDNLAVLRERFEDASIDLVYLDPPFQSGKRYQVVDGAGDAGQDDEATAFEDTWAWGPSAEATRDEVYAGGGRPAAALRAFSDLLGPSDLLAYLAMMTPRLVELRRVLRPSGSLYLHCDQAASHYLKVLLDAIFGAACFRNEIVWRYRRWPAKAQRFQRMHDVILFYAREPNGEHVFDTLYGYEALAASTLQTFGKKKQRADFSAGHRKPGTEEAESLGPPLSDVWEVSVLAPIAKERLGYPTQKPEALLERVIRASSREGDVVLDPFCGSGTTLAAADKLGRRFVGIDVTHLSLGLVRHRMRSAMGDALVPIVGEPRSVDDARALAARDPKEFSRWIFGRLGARPVDKNRRGRLGRAAGTIVFNEKARGAGQAIVAVGESVDDVTALAEILDREATAIGALVTLDAPSAAMIREASQAGVFALGAPRVQLLSVADVLGGAGVTLPLA